MNYSESKMAELVALLKRYTPQEGVNETSIANLVTFRTSEPQKRGAIVYEPAIVILGQGEKHCYFGGKKYDYSVGKYLTLFLPMPIEVEVVEASADKPLLLAAIKIDLFKIANIVMKMDRVKQPPAKSDHVHSSAIFVESLNDKLLEPTVKLLHTLDNPLERAVLGESLIEEIYFRLIGNDDSGSLHRLLQHRGKVQQISKAVDHIHQHLDELVSVDELANVVNMSTSGFRKTFREVMHMPPLQYAKLIKLEHTQVLLQEGKNVSEAAQLVGYSSPSQFSREYKRHFGVSPSVRTV